MLSPPVQTPFALQGEPPPWAHPTPSPSPLIRCPPDPPDVVAEERGESAGGAAASQAAVLMTQAVLWEVCMPFIGQMLEALEEAIAKAHTESRKPAKAASPGIGRKIPDTREKAFGSLFGPSPAQPTRGSSLRRGERLDEVQEEPFDSFEKAFSAVSSSCPTPTREPASATPSQKVTIVLSEEQRSKSKASSHSSSKASSPVLQGPEPSWQVLLGSAGSSAAAAATGNGGRSAGSGGSDSVGHESRDASLPQKVHSPSMPEMTDEGRLQMVAEETSGPSFMGNQAPQSGPSHDNRPYYLAWQQQHPAGGGQQRWADQRLSPTVSPMVPMTAPPGEVSATPALVLATAVDRQAGPEEDASSPDLTTSASTERSVMVCRHWKSKGWCRLEANCKFLHPEHKRGPGNAPAPKASANNSAGGAAEASSHAAAGQQAASNAGANAAAKSNARPSRRSGRNRGGAGGGAAAPVATANQAVAVGPVGNASGAPGLQAGSS